MKSIFHFQNRAIFRISLLLEGFFCLVFEAIGWIIFFLTILNFFQFFLLYLRFYQSPVPVLLPMALYVLLEWILWHWLPDCASPGNIYFLMTLWPVQADTEPSLCPEDRILSSPEAYHHHCYHYCHHLHNCRLFGLDHLHCIVNIY